jgi:hypothetical protein
VETASCLRRSPPQVVGKVPPADVYCRPRNMEHEMGRVAVRRGEMMVA